jgi:poly(3-hydroxyoctanoate) depolymerase
VRRWLVALAACSSAPEAPDASVTADAALASRCSDDGTTLRCPHETTVFRVGVGDLIPREVHFQTPAGTPPANGWPVVLLFQGSLFSAEWSWAASRDLPLGAIHQVDLVRHLLDAGFAVIAPEAKLDGGAYWDTNVPPWSVTWTASNDHELMTEILDAIAGGAFGPLDRSRLHASGISSGGYMTSRMALSYAGEFRSLAIHSASWATCSGPICSVPSIPADHPPTLFVHGEQDAVVPIETMRPYREQLEELGIATRLDADASGGHAFLAIAPVAITEWFVAHP